MAIEIERKFLVSGDGWRGGGRGLRIRQGYLADGDGVTVRVRRIGERAVITVKGRSDGPAREEFEYDIPLADAEAMLDGMCRGPLVEKTRYEVPHDGRVFEVDVFEGANAGLVMAEVELDDPAEPIDLPGWIGREVTGDARFTNARLSVTPFDAAWLNEGE